VEVVFTDYGNSAILARERIVLRYQDIPAEDVAQEMIDENVLELSTNSPKKLEKIVLVAEQICLAKWDDDDVWYRAKVTKTSEATVEVVFTDYGNSAILARERIVLRYQDIPAEDVAQEMIDENVGAPPSEEILAQPITTPSPSPQEEVKTVVSEDPVEERSVQCQWSVHDKCVARWGEDQCWYRGVITALGQDKTSASVRFVDYDNEDKVIIQDIVASSSEIPPGQEDFIDENVGEEPAVSAAKSMVLKKEEETRSEPSPSLPGPLNSTTDSGIGKSMTEPDFFNFMEKNGDTLSLSIKKKHVFKVSGPAGVTVLADGSVAIVSRMSDSVKIFSRTGAPLPCLLEGPRKFDKPTNILRLANGKIVVRDAKGIQLFTQEGKFVRTLGVTSQNCYYGLAEDSQGNVLTINYRDAAKPSGVGTTTTAGATDVFGLHEEGELCRQIELEDLVEEEEKVRSKCRHLGFSKGQVFISDIGLHRVFIINELEASVFGEAGDKPGQFSNPAEAAFDGVGNSIIVDSKNNRLQLVDTNQNPYPVKVDHPLVKPAGIHFDKDNNEVYVSNFGENTVVCFKLS